MRKPIPIAALVVAVIAVASALWWFRLSPETQEFRLSQSKGFTKIPVEGMVTMVDLGAGTCIPCKMMAPILEKVEKDYLGKAAIVFIDVRKHREAAKRFGIKAIPTQIFYDRKGQEVYRHEGFMHESSIVAQLKKFGVR